MPDRLPWEGDDEMPAVPATPRASEANEVNAMWRARRTKKQVKRETNRKTSAEILIERGIAFRTNNDGVHLMIDADSGVIDFWPGTGRWKDRETNTTGFGISSLLAFMGVKFDKQRGVVVIEMIMLLILVVFGIVLYAYEYYRHEHAETPSDDPAAMIRIASMDGCDVYRFEDGGPRYFVRCNDPQKDPEGGTTYYIVPTR